MGAWFFRAVLAGILSMFLLGAPGVGSECGHAAEQDSRPLKTILVVHTFEAKIPWVQLFNRYFTAELQKRGVPDYEVNFENLDLVQFDDDHYKELLWELLNHKTATSPPDIVLVTFPAAIHFVVEKNLFDGIPKIFVLPSRSGVPVVPDAAVVSFAFDFKGNIAHALDLLPDTKEIFVVGGFDKVDKQTVAQFRNETKEFEKRVTFRYLTEMEPAQVLSQVAHLPSHSFVYYLSYTANREGHMVVSVDFCRSVGQHANRPVLTYYDLFALQTGILGGRVTTTKASATTAAEVVARVFAGQKISSIALGEPTVGYIYDWEQVVKWHIDPAKLPVGSLIQNRTYSFFEVFKWRIIGGILLLVLESLLLIGLLININKRRKAEFKLRQYHAELESKVRERTEDLARAGSALRQERDLVQRYLRLVEAIIITLDRDGIITMINRKGCELLGYEEQELVGKNWYYTCLPQPEGREVEYRRFREMIKGEGKVTAVVDFEHDILTRDGRKRLIAWRNNYFRDENGQIVGTIRAGEDITDRKLAEAERERLIGSLQAALSEIKTLEGILPICSFCKKIRDNQGSWHQLESYMHSHSGADFSHTVCPQCLAKHYPELIEARSEV